MRKKNLTDNMARDKLDKKNEPTETLHAVLFHKNEHGEQIYICLKTKLNYRPLTSKVPVN